MTLLSLLTICLNTQSPLHLCFLFTVAVPNPEEENFIAVQNMEILRSLDIEVFMGAGWLWGAGHSPFYQHWPIVPSSSVVLEGVRASARWCRGVSPPTATAGMWPGTLHCSGHSCKRKRYCTRANGWPRAVLASAHRSSDPG